MTIQEEKIYNELQGMREVLSSLTLAKKERIEALYKEVMAKEFIRTTCRDCYNDAIVIMMCQLKKEGCKKVQMFRLKNGAIIQPRFGIAEFLTPDNCTDEDAISWLKMHKDDICLFSRYPANWEELIAEPTPPKKTRKRKAKSE